MEGAYLHGRRHEHIKRVELLAYKPFLRKIRRNDGPCILLRDVLLVVLEPSERILLLRLRRQVLELIVAVLHFLRHVAGSARNRDARTLSSRNAANANADRNARGGTLQRMQSRPQQGAVERRAFCRRSGSEAADVGVVRNFVGGRRSTSSPQAGHHHAQRSGSKKGATHDVDSLNFNEN